MTKVSIKDKIDAVLMYENGETLKVVATKFKTSIPLVHYWKKNKDKLFKEFEWSIPSQNSNQKNTNHSQVKCKEECTSHVSNTSQNENKQNVFLESRQIENNNNNLDEIESNILKQFYVQRNVNNPRNYAKRKVNEIQTHSKSSKSIENEFSNQFKKTQNRLGPVINFQNQYNNFPNHLNNYRNESCNSKKTGKINQNRRFVSGLSKVRQLQLKEYYSLKNVYDTQMDTGEKLKEREIKMGNNSNDDENSLADEIEEYNKVINGDLFIKIIERLEYLETVLFYLID